MEFAEFIETWGYLAVFVGACLEGETVLLLAGIASGAGLLYWPVATLTGWLGTFSASQAWYLAGRFSGPRFLATRPRLAAGVATAQHQLELRGRGLFVAYRFLYGLRTVTPFAIGAAGVPPAQFMVVDAVSWLLWLGAISGLGWAVGEAAIPWLETVFASQKWLLAAIVVVVVARLAWRRARARHGQG